MVDFIVVGAGLAGVTFAKKLENSGRTFVMISNQSQQSSLVAGGIYNPIVLKRFTSVWKSFEQIELLNDFFGASEPIHIKMAVLRKFTSVEEQNNWFQAADKPNLSKFLSTDLVYDFNKYVPGSFGFGKVNKTGRIDVKKWLNYFVEEWKNQHKFQMEAFDYSLLSVVNDGVVSYKSIRAKNVIFCEGYGIIHNPYFNYLPLKPCKGELLTFYAPDLKLDAIVKSDGFIFPIGNDYYKIGATYEWDDSTNSVTKKGRELLISKLDKLISCGYEIVNQEAAIRPTVSDRRPLIGKHPLHDNIWVLNGLGTRGVMIAPYVAEQLLSAVYKGKSIDKEIDVKRYESLFEQ